MAPGKKREHIDPERARVTRSLSIPMPFVHEEDHKAAGRHGLIFVEPVSGLWLRNIAEQLARCFTRSTPFDGGIYSARYPGPIIVVLLPMSGFDVGDGTHYSGAIGVHPADERHHNRPVAQWFWVHPFDRRTAHSAGGNAVERHWHEVLERWPAMAISGPFTQAGKTLADRLNAPIVG